MLWLLFFIEVQPANRHGESTSTAIQLSHNIYKVPLLLQNLGCIRRNYNFTILMVMWQWDCLSPSWTFQLLMISINWCPLLNWLYQVIPNVDANLKKKIVRIENFLKVYKKSVKYIIYTDIFKLTIPWVFPLKWKQSWLRWMESNLSIKYIYLEFFLRMMYLL